MPLRSLSCHMKSTISFQVAGPGSRLTCLTSFHEGLDKWVEVGNSGMFRPEMLLPMGLPEDVSVIAWGLSLER